MHERNHTNKFESHLLTNMHSDGGIEFTAQLESNSDEDDNLRRGQSLRDQGRGSESSTFNLTSVGNNDPRIAFAEAVVGPESRTYDMRYDDNDDVIALAEPVIHPKWAPNHLVRNGENDSGSILIEATNATNLTNKMARLRCLPFTLLAYKYSAKQTHFTLVTNRHPCSAHRSCKTNCRNASGQLKRRWRCVASFSNQMCASRECVSKV